MSEETAKKLAMEVRQSNKSEEFDLSGYGPNSVTKLVQDAFTAPLPLGNMVRLSFVVGGGKKVRQKYNDGLERLLCDALNGIGFTEDKGAALSLECAGQYKYQHDLGKDLKFVHVFPRVDTAAAAAAEAGDSASADAMSPSQLLLFSELPIFQRMVAAKTPSFAQRKRVLDVLKQAKSDYAALEAKLAALEALNEREQQLLDELDTDALDEKQKWLAKEMEAMVAAGQLSKEEKAMVLEQLHTKLEAVETQIALAESEGKEKRAAKLKEVAAPPACAPVPPRPAGPVPAPRARARARAPRKLPSRTEPRTCLRGWRCAGPRRAAGAHRDGHGAGARAPARQVRKGDPCRAQAAGGARQARGARPRHDLSTISCRDLA